MGYFLMPRFGSIKLHRSPNNLLGAKRWVAMSSARFILAIRADIVICRLDVDLSSKHCISEKLVRHHRANFCRITEVSAEKRISGISFFWR